MTYILTFMQNGTVLQTGFDSRTLVQRAQARALANGATAAEVSCYSE